MCVNNMIMEWLDEIMLRGWQRGFEEGFAEGFKQGFKQGFEEGWAEAVEMTRESFGARWIQS